MASTNFRIAAPTSSELNDALDAFPAEKQAEEPAEGAGGERPEEPAAENDAPQGELKGVLASFERESPPVFNHYALLIIGVLLCLVAAGFGLRMNSGIDGPLATAASTPSDLLR